MAQDTAVCPHTLHTKIPGWCLAAVFQKKGYPKFKSKFYHDDSVTFPEGSFKLNGTSLHLQRIGQVVLSGSNPYEGCNTKQVVIKREEDKFYATVCYEVSEELIAVTDNGKAIGIDMC